MRPVLVLLNGLPGSGKSTLARAWCAAHPDGLPLALDIDVLRAMLGGWEAHLTDAGLAARSMALAAARVRLAAGAVVIVPQLLRRPDLADRLEALADETGAGFLHGCLDVDPAVAADRLRTRTTGYEGALEQSLEALQEELEDFLTTRSAVVRIAGDDALAALERLVEAARTDDGHRRADAGAEEVAMARITRFDHVGITVADLEGAVAFFTGLGLEVEGRATMEGDFVDTVIGIDGSVSEIATLRVPDGGGVIELSRFRTPESQPGSPTAMATELGLRNVCFEVDDLDAVLAGLAEDGYGLVGGVGRYEDAWRMAYVRGPEGIIVSLAARAG